MTGRVTYLWAILGSDRRCVLIFHPFFLASELDNLRDSFLQSYNCLGVSAHQNFYHFSWDVIHKVGVGWKIGVVEWPFGARIASPLVCLARRDGVGAWACKPAWQVNLKMALKVTSWIGDSELGNLYHFIHSPCAGLCGIWIMWSWHLLQIRSLMRLISGAFTCSLEGRAMLGSEELSKVCVTGPLSCRVVMVGQVAKEKNVVLLVGKGCPRFAFY